MKPESVRRGNRSAFATPMRAVAAASWRSAARMSGRRCSSAAGESTASVVKCGAISRGASSAVSAPGRSPSSTARRFAAIDLRGDERRNRRFGRRAPSRGARDVELAAAAELEPHARELERLLLIAQVRARNGRALLRAAQLDVVARDLGRDEHLRVAQVRDRRHRRRRPPLRRRDARGRRGRAPIASRGPRRSSRRRRAPSWSPGRCGSPCARSPSRRRANGRAVRHRRRRAPRRRARTRSSSRDRPSARARSSSSSTGSRNCSHHAASNGCSSTPALGAATNGVAAVSGDTIVGPDGARGEQRREPGHQYASHESLPTESTRPRRHSCR